MIADLNEIVTEQWKKLELLEGNCARCARKCGTPRPQREGEEPPPPPLLRTSSVRVIETG